MEPTAPQSSPSPEEGRLSCPGELVVLTGRLSGTKRPLSAPLTLLGRSSCCEVRLNVGDVSPLHCAIIEGPEGLSVRDLSNSGSTLVNGEPVVTGPLRHGDVLGIGPFQFRIDLANPDGNGPLPTRAALEAERDALRIQAAAVVAQQAALSEEERQLQHRRTALQRQKEQLATHLEQRRHRLLEMQEQTRQDRAALKAEQEAARQQQQQVEDHLACVRQDIAQTQEQALKERRRFVELRKRLKRRWRKHWQVHEADLKRRQQQLAAGHVQLDRERADLERERARLMQDRLRFNGEVELGRRQLREEWQQLGLAQQEWEATLNEEQGNRSRRLAELEQRAADVSAAEKALAEQKRLAEQTQLKLTREAEGLEVRIRHQRARLVDQEQQLARLGRTLQPVEPEAPSSPQAVRPAPARAEEPAPVALAHLAGTLADQRQHLVEQWEQVLALHEAWQQERSAVLGELEAAGQQLAQRELRIAAQEQAVQAGAVEVRQRQEALGEVRCALEGWQARLTAREAAWEGERAALLAEVRAHDERAEAQVQRLEELRERRVRRRSQEIEATRIACLRHEEMRRDYVSLWQECQQRRATLAQEQRALAAHAVALEQYRQELLVRTQDMPGAEKRLERLRKKSLARIQAEERDLAADRESLLAETGRLEARAGQLRQQEETLVGRQEDLAHRLTEWEDQREANTDAEVRKQQEMSRLRFLHEQAERELNRLREEVERIARLLIDEEAAAAPPPAANQAA
jgi:pSer/pThr/pTyr-binding forkhead associated (FHA) protein